MKLIRFKFFFLMLLIVIFSSPYVKAQEVTLTLEDAIYSAIDSNYTTKIAMMDVSKAQAAVNEAYGYALPTVDFSASYGYFIQKAKMPFPDFETMLTNAVYGVLYEEFPDPDFFPNGMHWTFPTPQTELMEFALSHNLDATFQLTQILFNSAVFNGIGAAQVYLDASKVMVRSTVAKNINDIENAFYGVLLAQEMLEITKDSYKNALENVENVRKLNKEGFVSDFDLMSAEVQVENIKPTIQKIENTVKSAKDGLKILLGIDQDVDIELSGSISDDFTVYSSSGIPSPNSVITEALEGNFDIKALEMKKTVDKAFVDVELSDYYPTLAGFANYKMAGMGNDFGEIQSYKESMVGLSFSINLFRGEQTKNRVQQKRIEMDKTQQQLYQLEEYIKSQVVATILELQRVEMNIESQKRNVELAEKSYSLAEKRYKEGTGTQLEIKNANLELKTARTNMLQSKFDYIKAYTKLKHLSGNIDEKYLKSIDRDLKMRTKKHFIEKVKDVFK